MFCNNCGKKIKPGAARCSCGAPAEQAEYCGGFWGLANMNPESGSPGPQPDMSSGSPTGGKGYNPAREPTQIRSSDEDSGYYSRHGDRQDREKKSFPKGGVITAIIALAVLIAGGSFIYSRLNNPDDPAATATEGKTEIAGNTFEDTEEDYSEENEATAEEKLTDYQQKYVDLYLSDIDGIKERLHDLSWDPDTKNEEDYIEDKDPCLPLWDEYSQRTKDIRQEFTVIEGENKQSRAWLKETEEKILTAEIDTGIYDNFNDIVKDNEKDDTYVISDRKGNRIEKLTSGKEKTAKKFFDKYNMDFKKTEAGKKYREKDNRIKADRECEDFVSWKSLRRMEVMLANYCIDEMPDPDTAEGEEAIKEMYSEGNRNFQINYSYACQCRDDLSGSDYEDYLNIAGLDKIDQIISETKDKGKKGTSSEEDDTGFAPDTSEEMTGTDDGSSLEETTAAPEKDKNKTGSSGQDE